MARRIVIGGKVMRAPDLELHDLREVGGQAPLFLAAAGERTRDQDKALLVRLGVDGDVPLAQARINAGLDDPRLPKRPDRGLGEPKKRFSDTFSGVRMMIDHFSNDNDKRRAEAA